MDYMSLLELIGFQGYAVMYKTQYLQFSLFSYLYFQLIQLI